MFELVLGIESSGDRGSVALNQNGALVAERFTSEPNRHAESLLPMVEQLLRETGFAKQHLCAISVDMGPGSYTGLRVGIALANGIGLGLGIPVVGVGSLATLASALGRRLVSPQAAEPSRPVAVAALLDARRGESFFAAFDRESNVLVQPSIIANAALGSFIQNQLAGYEVCIAGGTAEALADLGLLDETLLPPAPLRAEPGIRSPSAYELTLLAGSPLACADPLPFYLRDADPKLPALPQNPLSAVD